MKKPRTSAPGVARCSSPGPFLSLPFLPSLGAVLHAPPPSSAQLPSPPQPHLAAGGACGSFGLGRSSSGWAGRAAVSNGALAYAPPYLSGAPGATAAA